MKRLLLSAAAASVLATGSAMAADSAPSADAPAMRYAFTIHVQLGPAQEQGVVDGRRMRFIPITGGTVSGPRLTGTVMPGGGDWQAVHPDGLTEVNARYTLKAADGTVIDIVNPGVRVASPEVLARMLRGEDVDPAQYYFRTNPRFSLGTGAHDWLRRTLFVARGVRRPDHVEITVFAVE